MTWEKASPCSTRKKPIPESIVCQACKAETEVWSDEEEAVCHSCGSRIAASFSNKVS